MPFIRTAASTAVLVASIGIAGPHHAPQIVSDVEIAAEAPTPAAPVDPAEISVSLDPVVVVHDGATAVQRAEIDAAVVRFVDAGLPLPDLEVSFHDDDEPCKGHLGLYSGGGRVRICSDLAFVATHELAHAWERHTMTDETREAFVEFAGLPSWRDADTPWNERGVEHTAITIQKVLMAENPNPDLNVWRTHADRYEVLTGAVPHWAVVPFLTGPEAVPTVPGTSA